MYYEIVLLGVIVSILYYEFVGLSPGGLIVPGYIALCLQTPNRIIYTLVLSLMALGIGKLINRVMILYGRRRFAAMILITVALHCAIDFSGILPLNPGMIGVLVPGILAQDMERQGVLKSLLSLFIVTGILAIIMMWFGIQVFPL